MYPYEGMFLLDPVKHAAEPEATEKVVTDLLHKHGAKIEQSERAVEIQNMRVQAEIEPLQQVAGELRALKDNGGEKALQGFIRNIKLPLYQKAKRIILEEG